MRRKSGWSELQRVFSLKILFCFTSFHNSAGHFSYKSVFNLLAIRVFLSLLFISQLAQAQGTIYVSSLSETSTGSAAVGSDSWFATLFITGNNADGYLLDSVQLAMADATGNPSGFTVMLYSAIANTAVFPGSSLGTLNGSLSPVTAGTYIYTPDTDIVLLPNMNYFIVLTAGTTVANGAYEWSVTSTSSPGYNSYHWASGVTPLTPSSNGSIGSWNHYISDTYGQFAITATAVPELSPSWLFLFGGGILFYARRGIHRR
jgi:hypothetical protein